MYYRTKYSSPLGNVFIVCDETDILGVWIEGQKYFCTKTIEEAVEKEDYPLLVQAKDWLDRYFKGENPDISELPLKSIGSGFRQEIWNILKEIPYGNTMTYGDIAKRIAKNHGKERMSSQAVGGAVGHNPISIIIPCHRVIGSGGNLTGYAGGLDKKISLLEHEQIDLSKMFIPKLK